VWRRQTRPEKIRPTQRLAGRTPDSAGMQKKSPEQLLAFMQPLVSGIGKPSRPKPQLMTLEDYIQHLRMLSPFSGQHMTDQQAIWFKRVASIRKRQRAYGLMNQLQDWVQRHGWLSSIYLTHGNKPSRRVYGSNLTSLFCFGQCPYLFLFIFI
jgi:hypothetical protein